MSSDKGGFLKGGTTSEEAINSVCIRLLLIVAWVSLPQESSEWRAEPCPTLGLRIRPASVSAAG